MRMFCAPLLWPKRPGKVAVIPQVRAALVDFQRSFAARAGGAVLDGRDIGTVICPEAAAKLFVTATAEVRAARRYAELAAKGAADSLDQVLADVRARDARDADRVEAPMRAAQDAVVIDTLRDVDRRGCCGLYSGDPVQTLNRSVCRVPASRITTTRFGCVHRRVLS